MTVATLLTRVLVRDMTTSWLIRLCSRYDGCAVPNSSLQALRGWCRVNTLGRVQMAVILVAGIGTRQMQTSEPRPRPVLSGGDRDDLWRHADRRERRLLLGGS